MESNNVKVMQRSSDPKRNVDIILRVIAFALTLVVVIVVGIGKEKKLVSVSLPYFPTLNVLVTAKWQYMSSLVFLLVSNVIACFYAAVSTLISLRSHNYKTQSNIIVLALTMVDLVMVALLFAANGAATAVGLISQKGNSHVQWHKVCNMVEGFCNQITAGVVISVFGSVVFLWLVVLSIYTLHRK